MTTDMSDMSDMSDPGETLASSAGDLYCDLGLTPLLSRLMEVVCRLTEAAGGSVSLLNPTGEAYVKVAERGTDCRVGESFSLDEGLTGQVVSRQGPVTLLNYAKVKAGHLPADHPARNGGVAGIPIWWRGDVIGVNVVFAGVPRQFQAHEVDHLEMVTQLAAPGIVLAAERDLGLSYKANRALARRVGASLEQVGSLDPAPGATGSGGQRWETHGSPSPSQVARLLAEVASCLASRLDEQGGSALDGMVEEGRGVAAWQTVMGDLLSRPEAGRLSPPEGPPPLLPSPGLKVTGRPRTSPLTPREGEVLGLLAQGLSDRAIARELLISTKTVEKHVGAVLRKTDAESRTAAVIHALETGWIGDRSSWRPLEVS